VPPFFVGVAMAANVIREVVALATSALAFAVDFDIHGDGHN
jgi:hypothetical protein